MSDPRRLAFDGETALATLRGKIDARHFTPGTDAQVIAPVAPLLPKPGAGRAKDLIYGEPITLIAQHGDHSFVQSKRDHYVGYVLTQSIGAQHPPTHRIIARSSHAYTQPDFKSEPSAALSFGSEVRAHSSTDRFLETDLGHIPREHLANLDTQHDPVTLAERFLGTPYLWGGNSAWGIDCSGLVQAALHAAGHACPRDSDMIFDEFGIKLMNSAQRQRGDLVFWKGHVGILRDADTLLHANAYHMAVASEPLEQAIARIGAQEFGQVTGYRRVG